jgi:CubicO group peptidase (beta-lactamase class C family)
MFASRRLLVVVVIGFGLLVDTGSASGQVAGDDLHSLLPRIDSLVLAELGQTPSAGLSVAVQRGADLLLAKGYGSADLENSVPITTETVFRIGSITKQFTAVSVLRLMERGRIRLQDPITRFLPGFPTQGHTVTIHHLLTHTSGIKSYTGDERFEELSRRDLADEELLELFVHDTFDFAPGEQWKYNNSAYYLLGMIIEEITGQEYADYLDEHIFDPLGMTGSSYCDLRAMVPHRARGYSVDDGELVNSAPISMNTPGAAGALCSTTLDLLRWQRALDGNRLISPESRRLMLTSAVLNDGETTGYGYGLGIGDLEGHPTVSHGGGINGFSTALATYPDDDLVVVVLGNTESRVTGLVANGIARILLGLPMAPSGEGGGGVE